MIFIVDNGKSYSDHSLTFYEIDMPEGANVKEVGLALVMLDTLPYPSSYKPFVVGVANSVDWWQGSTVSVDAQSVKEALTNFADYLDEDDLAEYKEELRALKELFG
jgi:uncharacterized linocin/CFP29 family protein